MVWHWIVKSWLQQKAQEKIYETVAETVRQRGKQAESEAAGGRVEKADVAVIFALAVEAGGMEDLLEDVITTRGCGFVLRQGRLDGKSVLLVESGVGGAAAHRATEAIIHGHRPTWVISSGFAGGLTAEVRRGDIVLADALIDESGKEWPVETSIPADQLDRLARCHVGRLLTAHRILKNPDEKAALGRKHSALAVDMESTAVVDVCRRTDTRFLALRMISDTVHDRLPADLDHLMHQESAAGKLGAVMGSVFRRPSSVKDMLRLKEEALLASDRLAGVLKETIVALPGCPDRGDSGS